MPRNWQLQLRRDTAANWTAANPTLAAGEGGYETDTGKLKIGDGATAWAGLAYFAGAGGGITAIDSPGATIAVTNPAGPTADLDLPASGAAAGTYGDASHTSRVTVNAEGIVTSIAAVAISGLSGSGLVLLFDSTLGADAASIDTGAGGVATTYTELFIFCRLRTKDATVNGDCQFRFNNDSGANYATSYIGSVSGTAPAHDTASAQTAANFWTMLGDSASSLANAFGTIVAQIPDYAGTSAIKTMTVTSQMVGTGSAQMYCKTGFSAWNSTAAISRVAVMAQSGANLKAGSRMTIYAT